MVVIATWDTVPIDPALLTGRGYNDSLTVGGVAYPRYLAYVAAGLSQAAITISTGQTALNTTLSAGSMTVAAALGAGQASVASALATGTAAVAAAATAAGLGYYATSATADTIALGATSIAVDIGKTFAAGQFVCMSATASPTNYMLGTVTSYNALTGAMVLNVLSISGAGTFAAWSIVISGPIGPQGIQGIQGIQGVQGVPGVLSVPASPAITGYLVYKSWANRADLRLLESAGYAIVESIGLFTWASGSIEPDDDETCFATATGAWTLDAVDPDYSFAAWIAEFDNVQGRASDLEGRAGAVELRTTAVEGRETAVEGRATLLEAFQAKFLSGSFVMSLTSLASVVSANFTASVPAAAIGDRVIVNPGDAFGTTAADQGKLSYAAYVSAPATVTVSIRNASAASATLTASTWSILVVKQ